MNDLNPILYTPYSRPTRSNSMDSEKVRQWIESHSSDPNHPSRIAASHLIEVIRHIGQDELEYAFKNSLSHINLTGSFVAAVEPEKSSKWMTDLAEEILQVHIPRVWVIPQTNQRVHADTVFIFEDGVFSGEQIDRKIRAIWEFTQPKKFIIVCPFMTRHVNEVIKKLMSDKDLQKRGSVDIEFLPHYIIPTVSEAIRERVNSEEEAQAILNTLTTSYWGHEVKPKLSKDPTARLIQQHKVAASPIDDVPIKYRFGPDSRGVVYFDHKVPDGYSFPSAIRRGQVINHSGLMMSIVKFIPTTTPPYKGNRS